MSVYFYLSGPMQDLPEYNFPEFHKAAKALRAEGWRIWSPAEADEELDGFDPKEGDGAALSTNDVNRLLARDIEAIAHRDCCGVVVLDGWEDSTGARLEVHVARCLGKPIYKYAPETRDCIRVLFTRFDERPECCPDVDRVPDPRKAKKRAGAMATGGAVPGVTILSFEEADRNFRRMLGKDVTITRTPLNDLGQPNGEPVVITGALKGAQEFRVVNPETGGAKGAKREDFSLLPWDALGAVARVYAFGAEKYERDNWRRGYSWSLSFAALQRHLAAFWTGEDFDPESGEPHLAHAAFHVLALLVYSAGDYDSHDDRYVA